MGLTRGQKRMRWVFDAYGENAPLTAMYTWATLGGSFGYSQQSLADLFRWSLDLEMYEAAYLRGISPFTVGQLVETTTTAMRRSIGTSAWKTPRLNTCSKLIPAVARWVQHELDAAEAGPQIDHLWDTPAGSVAERLTTMPPPRALDRLQALSESFGSLCDWYLAEHPDLGQYPTWESALADSRLWHSNLTMGSGAQGPVGPVVYEWDDGWTVQRLQTAEAFRHEGRALGHCIADGMHYFEAHLARYSRFYSLRTPKNVPWITFEVVAPVYTRSAEPAVVEQVKGCKNRLPGTPAPSRDCSPPDPTECTRVFDFLAAAGSDWTLGPEYQTCWAYTAAALGLPPAVQKRDTTGFQIGQLIRPPSHPPLEPGTETEEFQPRWWNEPDS